MPLTNWARRQLLKRLFDPEVTPTWLGLALERPEYGRAGDASVSQLEANRAEPNVQGYARRSLSLVLAEGGYWTNSAAVTWVPARRGEYVYYTIWDASTGGKALYWDRFESVIVVPTNSHSLVVPAYSLVLEL